MKPFFTKKTEIPLTESTLSSSFSSPKLRIKYFTCGKGKDHEGEVLNYVCVKKDCSKRGLLCSMCKIDHVNHTTIPLKILLSKLQGHKEKPVENSDGFQNQLAQLESIHKTMLFDLKVCVESLAEKFREIQVHINDQFSKAKIELLERVQINMKFNSFIEQAINNKFQNRESFIQDMNRISGMIDVKEGEKDGKDAKEEKDKELDIKFSANFDLVVKKLSGLQVSVSESFKKIQKFVCEDLKVGKYQDVKANGKKDKEKEKEKEKTKEAKVEELIKTGLVFTPDYKASSIVLESKNKVARQTKTNQGRFVFSNYQLQAPKQKITFKIKTLKNWIGLGVGIRQKLKFLNFRFEYSNLGHGSYLISSNGYSWSHTEQSSNIAVVAFKFKEGDLIQLEYEKTKVVYSNKSNNDKHQLKLAFNQAEEKDIFFCANLCSEGDSVEIVEG